MITFHSSYESVQDDARKGMSIINAAKRGNELQKYKEGDKVQSTKESPYNFTNGVIIESYKDSGYFRYVVKHDGAQRTYRQKDITLQ